MRCCRTWSGDFRRPSRRSTGYPSFDFPDVETNYDMVCVRHPYEYPMNEGRVVSSSGLDIPVEDYEKYFEEQHVQAEQRAA